MKFLKALCETPGIPGREERVRELLQKHTEGWWDSSEVDRVGNLWGRLKASTPNSGDEKSVVIACHMDQIGFYVRHVDDEGFLRIQQAGGFDTRNLFARRVLVMTSKGGDIVGILNPATKPVHVASPEERKKIPDVSEFVIDTGLSKEKIKEIVRPGDPVVLEQTTIEMGDHVCGQCMDNRISQWVALNAIEKAKGKTVYDIDWVGTVQEEVGLRGATVAAQTSKADVGIAIDVTLAVDTPGISKEEGITRLGNGVAIKVMDSSAISDRSLFEEFVALAESNNIKYQYEVLPLGGTDAAALQRFGPGRRAICLSVPCRYVHTVVETVHKDDLNAAVDLLAAWLTTDSGR